MATKPSIALIPSAQGSKFYSVLPSSGVGDFDFTRSGGATRINSQGLIETVADGVSRLNYPLIDGKVVGCPSHLLEPQSTNLVQYSEDFSQSYWTKLNASINANLSISPSGALNADKFNLTGSSSYIYRSTSTANGSYVFSIFVKKIDLDVFRVNVSDTVTGEVRVYFNFSDESISISKSGGSITDFETNFEKHKNGWYKINVIAKINSGSNVATYFQSNGSLGSFFVWGAQLEQGSYPTSYIPNYGTALGVTRSAETANGSGDAATFNDSEGVLMAEISANSSDVAISLSDNTFNNSISFGVYLNKISAVIRKDGGYITSGIIDNSTNAFNNNKIAIKYNSSSCDFYVNGFVIGSSSGVTYNSNVLDNLNLNRGSANDLFYGNTKQIQYFDKALTDSELEQISSWTSFNEMAISQLYSLY